MENVKIKHPVIYKLYKTRLWMCAISYLF